MMLSASRLKELEKRWERNRKRGSARGYIVEVPDDMADMNYRGLERPPGLRATDFVQELERLALEWGDRRFAHAVRERDGLRRCQGAGPDEGAQFFRTGS